MRAIIVVGLVPFGCYLVELFHVMSLPIGPQLLHGGLYLTLYARVLPRTIGVAEVVGDPELLERLMKVLHVLRTVVRLDPHHREGRVIQKLSQEDLRVARGPGSEYPCLLYTSDAADDPLCV